MTRVGEGTWRRRAAGTVSTLAAVAVLALGGVACDGPGQTPGPSGPVELTVFAAASLRDAVEQVAAAYEADHPGTTVIVSTDSSAALATQIEQGAPADVFLSADITNPQRLVDAALASGEPIAFAGNALAVIVPHDNPARIDDPADLAREGLRIIAAGDDVPISGYAAALVANLAATPGYPPGFAAAYNANVASREDNVRAVVAKIELGEGDAAIVYATDASSAAGVLEIPLPAEANVEATYAGIVVAASEDVGAARTFLEWLAGPDGYTILAELGFLPPPV